MREIRMEVLNEAEAIQYCEMHGYNFIKCYTGKGSNSGKLMMLATDNSKYGQQIIDEDEFGPIPEKKDTVIFTNTSTGKMYLGKRSKYNRSGVVFRIDQAEKFTSSAAQSKVHFMNKKGNYFWITYKLT